MSKDEIKNLLFEGLLELQADTKIYQQGPGDMSGRFVGRILQNGQELAVSVYLELPDPEYSLDIDLSGLPLLNGPAQKKRRERQRVI